MSTPNNGASNYMHPQTNGNKMAASKNEINLEQLFHSEMHAQMARRIRMTVRVHDACLMDFLYRSLTFA